MSLVEIAANFKANGSFNLKSGSTNTRSNVRAIGFIDKNFIPAIGQPVPNGIVIGELNVTLKNVEQIIRIAALSGKGIFFTDPMVSGTRSAVETKAGSKFGSQTVEESINEEDVRFDVTYVGATQDANGLRRMRGNLNRDAFIFTNNTLEIVRADRDGSSIGDVDIKLDGDNAKTATGIFSINAHLVPDFLGNYEYHYGQVGDIATPVRYTITVGTLTQITASNCNGEFKRFVATSAGGSIAVSTGITAGCQNWSLFVYNNGGLVPVSTSAQATCNTLTGLVTIPTTHAAGVAQYVLMVENSSGVFGEFKFEIEK